MIILDADSLMTGETIVRLASAMERHPAVALIQTLPIVVNARTLFGRLQQFSGRLYGPVIAAGIAWWHGSEGNYWGHNAIVRVRAFAGDAGLPELEGPQAVWRAYSEPRFRRSGADAAWRLGDPDGARASAAVSRNVRRRCWISPRATGAGAKATCSIWRYCRRAGCIGCRGFICSPGSDPILPRRSGCCSWCSES